MAESDLRRIFTRLDGIGERLSRLEGICKARQYCPERGEGGRRASDGGDRKWLQWLVGALISIIGALIGGMTK